MANNRRKKTRVKTFQVGGFAHDEDIHRKLNEAFDHIEYEINRYKRQVVKQRQDESRGREPKALKPITHFRIYIRTKPSEVRNFQKSGRENDLDRKIKGYFSQLNEVSFSSRSGKPTDLYYNYSIKTPRNI